MDISSLNGRTAEIVILSADTYLKEGLARVIAEKVVFTGPQVIHRGLDLYRLSLAGNPALSQDGGAILLIDERIFTTSSLCWEGVSNFLSDNCSMVLMLTGGRQHYCRNHHLNTRLPLDALGQKLSQIFVAKGAYRLCLDEILKPLNATEKTLLRLMTVGCTLNTATLLMHCSIKRLYHLRKQACRRLGVDTLSEMHSFMSFYRFMVYHERRATAERNMPSEGDTIMNDKPEKRPCVLATPAD